MDRPRGILNHTGFFYWIVLTTLILWVQIAEMKFDFCKCVGDTLDCSHHGFKIQSFDSLDKCSEEVTKLDLSFTVFPSFSVIRDKFYEITASFCGLKKDANVSQLDEKTEVLVLTGNQIKFETKDALKNLSNLKTLKMDQTAQTHLEFLPSPCSLLHLDISKNRISKWNGIEECKQLELLDVSWTELMFDDDAFPGFENLKHLNLQGLVIKDFPTDVLRKLPNLLELDISRSDIKSLKKEDFVSVPNLRSLTIDVTNNFPPDIFSELPYLTELHLVKSSGSFSPTKEFISALINLDNFDMKNCHLTHVPFDEISNMTKLKKLDLSGNKLNSIPEKTFSDMHDLEWLSLRSTDLLVLESNTFSELSNLVHLDLRFNDISKLPNNMFSSLSNLTFLSLEENKIKLLQEDSEIFSGLQNLEILWFTVDKSTTEFPNAIFSDLQNLKFLFVKAPGLTVLHAETFSELKSLEELHIRNAKINLESALFLNLVSLRILDLSSSHLAELPDELLKGLDNLEKFSAAFCRLKNIPDNIFSGTGRLKEVNLQKNELKEIPVSALEKCTTLEVLEMSKNKISSLPDYNSDIFPNLWKIFLTSNKISEVSREKMLTWLPTGKRLELDLRKNKISSPKAFSWVLKDEEIEIPYSRNSEFTIKRDDAYISVSFSRMMCGDNQGSGEKTWKEAAEE